MQALVTPQWLRDHRNDERIVIADCRFALSASEQGAEEYATDHIPGALYFHLNRDLSGPKQEHGGRHPLPDPAALAALFSQAGIDEHTTVIAYDDQEMAMAGRLWWLLRYLGHDRVAVLDGGYAAWKKAGYEVTAEVPTPQARTFVPQLRPDMLVSVEGVKNREPEAVLLDSRAGERYRGEQEPLDPKAGHIPGARHFFYKDNLQADMTMLPAEQLRNRIMRLRRTRNHRLLRLRRDRLLQPARPAPGWPHRCQAVRRKLERLGFVQRESGCYGGRVRVLIGRLFDAIVGL